jgi:hypothetical protein
MTLLPPTFSYCWLECCPSPLSHCPIPFFLSIFLHHLHRRFRYRSVDYPPQGRWARFEIVFFGAYAEVSTYSTYDQPPLSLHLFTDHRYTLPLSIYTIIDALLRLIDTVPTHQIFSSHFFSVLFFFLLFLGLGLRSHIVASRTVLAHINALNNNAVSLMSV